MKGKSWVFLGVIFSILLVVAFTGIYFYNYHVFKTMRICVGAGQDIRYPCNISQDCVDLLEENNLSLDLSNMPEFLQKKYQEVLDEAIYCDNTCFFRNIRGIGGASGEIEILDSCEGGETEILIEIRGKDGLDILKYMKSLKE